MTTLASLTKGMDPLVAQEYKLGQKTDAVVKRQCIELYQQNPTNDQLAELADHYRDLYGPGFLSLATLKLRLRLGRTYPKPEDWNDDLSVSAHRMAASLAKAKRQQVVFGTGDWHPDDKTTADAIAEQVKLAKHGHQPDDGTKALNVRGGGAIADKEGNELHVRFEFPRPGMAEVSFDTEGHGTLSEPEVTLVNHGQRLVLYVEFG